MYDPLRPPLLPLPPPLAFQVLEITGVQHISGLQVF